MSTYFVIKDFKLYLFPLIQPRISFTYSYMSSSSNVKLSFNPMLHLGWCNSGLRRNDVVKFPKQSHGQLDEVRYQAREMVSVLAHFEFYVSSDTLPWTELWFRTNLPPSGVQLFLHTATVLNGLMIVVGGNGYNISESRTKQECFSAMVQAYDIGMLQFLRDLMITRILLLLTVLVACDLHYP